MKLGTKFLFCIFVSSIALSFALLTGCGSGSSTAPVSPTPAAAFSVKSITPASGTTQVAASATIQITFSAAADPATVNATDIQVTNPKQVTGTVSYSATAFTATFTPSAALAPNTTFTVTVTGVTSASGTAMASSFTSAFVTVPGTGTGPTATMQYQASLLSANQTTSNGQMSIDTDGNVSIQLTGATASTTYTVQFCPAFDGSSGGPAPPCFNVGTVDSGANGSGTSTFLFPQSGSWAGDFELDTGGNDEYQTFVGNTVIASLVASEVYMSTLQPQSTVNGTGVTGAASDSPGTQEPLTSGTITYSKGSVQFVLTGASPSMIHSTSESEGLPIDSSGTYSLGQFTTDASGNASSTEPLGGNYGDIFEVNPQSGTGFIGGFSVPK